MTIVTIMNKNCSTQLNTTKPSRAAMGEYSSMQYKSALKASTVPKMFQLKSIAPKMSLKQFVTF